MNYIDSFNINKTDYDARHLRNIGINEVTSLSNLPIDKRMIHATLSEASTLSVQDGMEVGEGLIVICECTAEFKLQFNSDSEYKFIGETGISKSILCQNETMFKIYITKSSDSSYVINLSDSYLEAYPEFTIHISKTISDPASMVTVDGYLDPEVLLSQFRRCLCKKVSDNNVKICYLNDNNSNQYHDGTASNTDGTEGDVMVYFPEMWYLGTDTDDEWVMNISTVEQPGYKHAPASLVGAYKAYATASDVYSRSGVDSSGNITMGDFSSQARNRGAGYHLIDYQQHCIIAWMFYARYKNTNSQAICGTGKNTYTGINCGVTNSLGMNDTTTESASSSSDMLVNFLGLEGCWGYKMEYMEGIHTHDTDGVIAYDKGDYHDQPFSSVQSSTKRILRTSSEGNLSDYISKIEGGEYMDMLPSETSGSNGTYFSDYGFVDLGSSLVFERSYIYSYSLGGVAYLYSGDSSSNNSVTLGSRLAFDGNIEIVNDVNTFKSLPVL